jgi:hypothetical protein
MSADFRSARITQNHQQISRMGWLSAPLLCSPLSLSNIDLSLNTDWTLLKSGPKFTDAEFMSVVLCSAQIIQTRDESPDELGFCASFLLKNLSVLDTDSNILSSA